MRDDRDKQIIKNLPKTALRLLQTVAEATTESGMKIYMVGGIVRDLLLSRPNMDIDIMVEGNAVALAETISSTLHQVPVIHKKFGTATFKLRNYRLDLSSCRSETYPYAGSLPEVKPGSLKEDLFRRDFTINTMAISISPRNFGELKDYFHGRQDLESGLIRTLHSKSFRDDATRIMRAVRYEQRLNFHLEQNTERLMLRDLDMLDTISGDRLRHEIILWFHEAHPEKILKRAGQLGILTKLHPSLTWSRHLWEAFQSARKEARSPSLVSLYLCLLIFRIEERQLDELLNRLNVRGGRFQAVTKDTLHLKKELATLEDRDIPPSAIYAMLKNFDIIAIRANLLLTESSQIQNMLELYVRKLRQTKTILNGKDLTRMGISEGKVIGIILSTLLTTKMDGKIRSRLDEENLVRSIVKDLS